MSRQRLTDQQVAERGFGFLILALFILLLIYAWAADATQEELPTTNCESVTITIDGVSFHPTGSLASPYVCFNGEAGERRTNSGTRRVTFTGSDAALRELGL